MTLIRTADLQRLIQTALENPRTIVSALALNEQVPEESNYLIFNPIFTDPQILKLQPRFSPTGMNIVYHTRITNLKDPKYLGACLKVNQEQLQLIHQILELLGHPPASNNYGTMTPVKPTQQAMEIPPQISGCNNGRSTEEGSCLLKNLFACCLNLLY